MPTYLVVACIIGGIGLLFVVAGRLVKGDDRVVFVLYGALWLVFGGGVAVGGFIFKRAVAELASDVGVPTCVTQHREASEWRCTEWRLVPPRARRD